jgi:O2-independent ubiquinone biosynthesis protein UbiV
MSTGLTLGPLLFHWPPERRRDFHFRIADEAPVDCVHVGEVVCWKRAPFALRDLGAVIDRLRAAGKQVVVSSLALVVSAREQRAMAELAARDDVLVEANDLGVAGLLAGRPHVIGPFVNVYNEATLAWLAARGAVRVCLPPELPRASLTALAGGTGAELEVLAFGRVPLALSARCFHARLHGRTKDACGYVCERDPDGLEVRTLDDQPFLAANGIQTLSHTCCNLIGELPALAAMGIRRFRLSPHGVDMVAVAGLFRDVLDHRRSGEDAARRLAELVPGTPFSNGFLHGLEGHRLTAAP